MAAPCNATDVGGSARPGLCPARENKALNRRRDFTRLAPSWCAAPPIGPPVPCPPAVGLPVPLPAVGLGSSVPLPACRAAPRPLPAMGLGSSVPPSPCPPAVGLPVPLPAVGLGSSVPLPARRGVPHPPAMGPSSHLGCPFSPRSCLSKGATADPTSPSWERTQASWPPRTRHGQGGGVAEARGLRVSGWGHLGILGGGTRGVQGLVGKQRSSQHAPGLDWVGGHPCLAARGLPKSS
ncbi:unnamed protein product [Lepidochelys olivacea]